MSESSDAIDSGERPEFLEEFKKTNPHLKKKASESFCDSLWRLLSERHRWDDKCCPTSAARLGYGAQDVESVDYSCFLDHLEEWEDTNTGLPVIIAHPYCCHTDKHLHCIHGKDRGDDEHRDQHARDAEYLAERGLWWKVSNASWYYKDTSLVVIARVDVLGNIALPVDWDRPNLWKEQAVQHHRFVNSVDMDELSPDLPRDLPPELHPRVTHVRPIKDEWWGYDAPDYLREEQLASYVICPTLDYEMIEARKLAEESVIRNRLAKKAPTAEAEGDYQLALNYYCDTAYIDRTGGFHRLAREQLAEAKRIITAHPDLDTTFLHFKNRRDREFICGQPRPTLSRLQLERRLRSMKLPHLWGRFMSDGPGTAVARIGAEKDWDGTYFPRVRRKWRQRKGLPVPDYAEAGGFIRIGQGGNLNLWKAHVVCGNGPYIFTISDGVPRSLTSPQNYCCETPEAAVEAAIDIWRRYDELASADILDSSRVER